MFIRGFIEDKEISHELLKSLSNQVYYFFFEKNFLKNKKKA